MKCEIRDFIVMQVTEKKWHFCNFIFLFLYNLRIKISLSMIFGLFLKRIYVS